MRLRNSPIHLANSSDPTSLLGLTMQLCWLRPTALAIALATVPGTAVAAQVLTFEGITAGTPIGGYYNGSGGPDFGVVFSPNAFAFCLNTLGSSLCSNTSRGGQGDPSSEHTGMFFNGGPVSFLNSTAGFTDGFSIFYSAIHFGASIDIWSGLSGTGSLLASIILPTTPSGPCPGYAADFCPFVGVGLSFAGTARSVTFGGRTLEVVFDDMRFGSSLPVQTVPEPSSLLLTTIGLAALGLVARRRIITLRGI